MKKNILIFGIILLVGGIILEFLSGAVLPGNFTIPLIYGSNQILWLFVALVGLIIGIVSFFLRKKK